VKRRGFKLRCVTWRAISARPYNPEDPDTRAAAVLAWRAVAGLTRAEFDDAVRQGLTLVHFSAQLERFVWDRGCV